MLFSRMLALAPVLMMMGAGGAAANAGAFEDDYSAYDEALGVMEVRTPAAKKQKQLDYSTDDDPYGVYEITDDGEGLDCYDVELERIQNEQVEGEDELDELDEGEVLDLKPIVKERRTSYTLAEKMRYVDLCDAAWRANPNGPCVEIAVSGVPEKDRVPPPSPPRIFEHPIWAECMISSSYCVLLVHNQCNWSVCWAVPL
jgi:hypothetical protein